MSFTHRFFFLATSMILNFGISSGCDVAHIHVCSDHIKKYSELNHLEVTLEMCNDLTKAIDCFHEKTATCDQAVTNQLSTMLSAFETIREACKDPDSVNSTSEQCDTSKIEACGKEINASSHNIETACSMVLKAKGCLSEFGQSCDNQIFDSLLRSQMEALDQLQEQCQQQGVHVNTSNNNNTNNNINVLVDNSCVKTEIEKCSKKLPSNPEDEKKTCSKVQVMKSCFSAIKNTCSTGLTIVDTQIGNTERFESKCHEMGYQTTDNSTSEQCDAFEIDACIKESNASIETPNIETICSMVLKVKVCLIAFGQTCDNQLFDSLLKSEMEALDQLQIECKHLGVYVDTSNNNTNVLVDNSCVKTEIEKCSKKLPSNTEDKTKTCSKIHGIKSCFSTIKNICPTDSDALNIIDQHIGNTETFESKCHQMGYNTTAQSTTTENTAPKAQQGKAAENTGNRHQLDIIPFLLVAVAKLLNKFV